MREIQFIVDYVKETYILEENTNSLIPKNYFEVSKIDFYLFIKNKISNKLFYFLKNKFPIKYLPYKEEASLYKKENGITCVELFIHQTKKSYIFDCYVKSGFFMFRLDKDTKDNIFRIIDTALTTDNYFKSCLRDYKIKHL